MPAQSRAQQRLMGLAYSNPEVRKQIGIKKKDARDFAKTKHDGLPEKVTMDEAQILADFAALLEEWKPLPVDKMNRQIEKKEKRKEGMDIVKAHQMRRVKAANADIEKTKQRHTGKDGKKFADAEGALYGKATSDWDKEDSQREKAAKAKDKGKDKKAAKLEKKADKNSQKGDQAFEKAGGMNAERMTYMRNNQKYVLTGNKHKDYNKHDPDAKSDNERQAEVNRKNKADRKTAENMMNKANLEKAVKAKPKREKIKGPAIKNTIKKEHMNFTDYVNSAVSPLYEAEGELPKCPPGYRYDARMKMCVPKSQKDSVGKGQKFGDKDLKPGQGPTYNVWGSSGYDGAGYAWEEKPTSHDNASGAA